MKLSWDGGETEFKLLEATSTAAVKDVFKKGVGYGQKLADLKVASSDPSSPTEFTNISFNDQDSANLQYAVQFDSEIAMTKFTKQKAKFVVTVLEASVPDAKPATYDMICASTTTP